MMAPQRLIRASLCLFLFQGAVEAPAQQPGQSPEIVSLTTRDGVQLRLSYFPSPQRRDSPEAKQVTPVVMLHDFKGTRAMFTSLANRLQTPSDDDPHAPGFAVVAVDLRAHGDSMRRMFPTGEAIDLDAARLRRADFVAMASLDLEAVRSFLVTKNDAGELNLNKLCLVGTGMGANVAANWAMQDWSAPPLAIGKQGQDVKALILISPSWSYNGLTFQGPMRFRPLVEGAAWMLIYGNEDTTARADVARIRKPLERFHPIDELDQQPSSLQIVSLSSKLQGETLLRQFGESVEDDMIRFLRANVAEIELPWINRRDRLP